MADIRIKDLATTATTTAFDDFMAVDGSTNGTRKMNAAAPAFLTSVTTPSLTSPAATNLTLAGGTAGSDSVVVSNTLAASSSIIGAFKVGNGTAATNVAIGGGNINAGGTGTFGGAVSYAGSLKEGSDNVISSSGTALLFGNSGTWTETRIGSTNASGIVTFYAGNAERMRIASTGAITMNAYGAGAATFDSSGNITSVSDARLKNITGTFTKGLAEIVKLTPKLYTWKPETGLVTDDINATLIAQDLIAAGLSEAVSTYRTVPVMEDDVQSAEDIAAGKLVTQHPKLDADGKAVTQRVDSNYSVSDRTVIAALVNAVKELKAEIDALKAAK